MKIELPFPPASLSGHASGSWRAKSEVTKKYRGWAKLATLEIGSLTLPKIGDIRIHFKFIPPDHRGDRTNFPNRLKPYIDGVAEALGVNDSRFLPSYEFCKPEKPGMVVIEILE